MFAQLTDDDKELVKAGEIPEWLNEDSLKAKFEVIEKESKTPSIGITSLTFPRGPEESTQTWYAGSRLGVHCCAVHAFAGPMATPKTFFYVSKVREKGCIYSLAIWFDFLARLDLSEVLEIEVWSDGGPHFRCNRTIATQTKKTIEAVQAAHGGPQEGLQPQHSDNFGVPSHFKHGCDGDFGHVRALIEMLARKEELVDISDFVLRVQQLHNDISATKAELRIIEFIDFFPKKSRQDFKKRDH